MFDCRTKIDENRGGRIAQWIVLLLLTQQPWVQILAPDFSDVAELINCSTLPRVRVDCGMSLIVK